MWNWANTIFTIILREIRCRFAGDPLGYTWTFLVPILWIGTLMFFFEVLDRTPAISTSTPAFIASGVIPYVLFRYTIASMARVASTHRHLVYFGRVRVSDLIFAAGILEVLNAIVTCLLIWSLIALVFDPVLIHDPLQAICGMAIAAIFGACVGRLSVIAGMIFPTVRQVVPVVLRPMFWISGIFFTAPQLPFGMQNFLKWNPLLHSIETVRSGTFLDYSSEFSNLTTPLLISSAFLLSSYLLQSTFQRGQNKLELI